MPRPSPVLVVLLALLPLAGCSESYSPNTYAAGAAQQAAQVERGVIVGARPVLIRANGTVGAVTGGAVGGVSGSQVPGGAIGSAFGAIGGTLVGGLVGVAADQAVADAKGWEYIVQEPAAHLVSVTQTDKVMLPIGLHVLVIGGKQARIVPDYTVQVPGAAKPAKPAPDLAAAPIYVTPLTPGVAPAAGPGVAAAPAASDPVAPVGTATAPAAAAAPTAPAPTAASTSAGLPAGPTDR